MKPKTKTANKPEAKILQYALNPETNWFAQIDCPLGFTKVPAELKVERTQRPDIVQQAKHVIRSRQVGGRYPFFTGLIPAGLPFWYFGDVYELRNGKKVNSFCLFHFTEAHQHLEVHIFPGYKLFPNRRRAFIASYWRELGQ